MDAFPLFLLPKHHPEALIYENQNSFSRRVGRLRPSTVKPSGATAGVLQRVKQGVNAPADLWEAADGLLAREVCFYYRKPREIKQSRSLVRTPLLPSGCNHPC